MSISPNQIVKCNKKNQIVNQLLSVGNGQGCASGHSYARCMKSSYMCTYGESEYYMKGCHLNMLASVFNQAMDVVYLTRTD